MSFDFETITLADVIESANTGLDAIKRAPIVERDTGFKCLRIQDVSQGKKFSEWGFTEVSENNFSKFQLKQSEILIARTGGSVGVNRFINEKVNAVFNNGLIRLRINKKRHDAKYVYYLLQTDSYRQHIHAIAHSTAAQPNMKIADFLNFKFVALNKNHEIEIAEILSSLDDRITLLRETNTTLEAIAQALFKSWFVDFDPVHAKQQGREPEGMDASTAALFPDSFEESELGLVPMGWRVESIGNISEILNGFAFKSEDYVSDGSGVFVLRTTNFNDNGYAERLSKDVFLPDSFLKSYAKYLCEPFDFHLVMVGASVGHTCTLLPHVLPALRNQNMWCFRPKNGFASKFFIHEIVKLKVIDALRSTSGSAREFFKKGDFEKNLLVLPDQELLADFEEKISALKNKIATNENQANLLTQIRDTLLPRLISGQLRLPDSTPA